MVFAELDWTPGTLEQCEDRAHRIGQKDVVHVHYLVAAGSLDDWVWSALSKKVDWLDTCVLHIHARFCLTGLIFPELFQVSSLQVRSVLEKCKLLGIVVAELLQALCPSCHINSIKALKDDSVPD